MGGIRSWFNLDSLPKKGSRALYLGLIWLIVIAASGYYVKRMVTLVATGHYTLDYPMPQYGLMSMGQNGNGPLGADYVMVYQCVRGVLAGQSCYHPQSLEYFDPWGRVATPPPVVIWMYVPFTWLPYPVSVIAHLFFQFGLFIAALWMVMKELGMKKYFALNALFVILFYLLTPVGLGDFERGQWNFYVATCLMFTLAAVHSKKQRYFILAGVFAMLKWTSLPFLVPFSLVMFFSRRWTFKNMLSIWVIPALSILLFWKTFLDYLPIVGLSESGNPTGVTFQHFLPSAINKILPLSTTAIVCLVPFIKKVPLREFVDRSWLFLFITFAIVSLGAGTAAFEYRCVIMVTLVTAFAYWWETVSPGRQNAMVGVALLFYLAVTFHIGFHDLPWPILAFFHFFAYLAAFVAALNWGLHSSQRVKAT